MTASYDFLPPVMSLLHMLCAVCYQHWTILSTRQRGSDKGWWLCWVTPPWTMYVRTYIRHSQIARTMAALSSSVHSATQSDAVATYFNGHSRSSEPNDSTHCHNYIKLHYLHFTFIYMIPSETWNPAVAVSAYTTTYGATSQNITMQFCTSNTKYKLLILPCTETNLMHCLSSVYSVTIPLHVSGMLVAQQQEVAMYICDNWYVLYVLLDCWQAWMAHWQSTN
jgi:hypothetical protein